MSASQFHHYDELVACRNWISSHLTECANFWIDHSHDEEYGGFFNCLSADGKVYDTTKYGWLQGRQVWMYCTLYTSLARFKKDSILQAAIKGGDFLMTHFKDPATSKVYFSTTRDGKPTKMQRTVFAEIFYCMAMAGLAKATQEEKYKEEALSMFKKIMYWTRVDPEALGRPKLEGNENIQSLAVPICVLSVIHEFEDSGIHCEDMSEARSWAVDSIKLHVQRDGTRVLENVTNDGKELQGSMGRLMNPGHIVECGVFLLKESFRTKSKDLKSFALKHFIDQPLEYGEDKKLGGLFYFLDVDGHSPIQLEWDMKLWWVHCEALIATLMSYHATGKIKYWDLFKKTMHYSSTHFVDKEHGEWFGYLTREGQVKMTFKGGPFKGCFHVPRTLLLCEKILTALVDEEEANY